MTPIPQEGHFGEVKDICGISGFSHSVGTCAMKQGACKLTLNVKNGIVEEALIETVGCSGMTHSACMASEILPGKTLLEAINTDLVCDAINVAMREMLLNLSYGRSQSAFSENGLPVGAALEDLGNGIRSQIGTAYGVTGKGPRYLELAEGYVQKLAVDADGCIIGYQYVNISQMMKLIADGESADEALKTSTGCFGRCDDAVRYIDPRRE